jgi:hypothetical protein
MIKIKSEFVNDDWERIYINGELITEGHSITARQLMRELMDLGLGIKVEFTSVEEDD